MTEGRGRMRTGGHQIGREAGSHDERGTDILSERQGVMRNGRQIHILSERQGVMRKEAQIYSQRGRESLGTRDRYIVREVGSHEDYLF